MLIRAQFSDLIIFQVAKIWARLFLSRKAFFYGILLWVSFMVYFYGILLRYILNWWPIVMKVKDCPERLMYQKFPENFYTIRLNFLEGFSYLYFVSIETYAM